MLGGGGRTETLAIEQTSNKIIHNSFTYKDINNICKDRCFSKKKKGLFRVLALHKRARHIRPRVGQRVSVNAQYGNKFMHSTVQLVLWFLVFVMSLTITYSFSVNKSNCNEVDAISGIAISTEQELKEIEINLSGSFYLTNDIIVDDSTWTPIGTSSISSFAGIFDGNGHSITFTQTIHIKSSSDNVFGGLFGYASGATIKNLGVNWSGENTVIYAGQYYTGLVVASRSSSASAGGGGDCGNG